MFLISLGLLDLAEPFANGAAPSSTTVQMVKFNLRGSVSPLSLNGWLSFFTVTLPSPVSDVQRDAFRRLQGPRYNRGKPWTHDEIWKLRNLPESTRARPFQYGWSWEPEQGDEAGTQDGVFYVRWLSKEAEEARKARFEEAGLKLSWDDELREIGALGARKEHVDLARIAYGRSHLQASV